MILDYDKWFDEYQPIINPVNTEDEAFNGRLYTYRQVPFKTFKPEYRWTLVEEDGLMKVVSGIRMVNRLGYFVTEKPRTEDTTAYLEPMQSSIADILGEKSAWLAPILCNNPINSKLPLAAVINVLAEAADLIKEWTETSTWANTVINDGQFTVKKHRTPYQIDTWLAVYDGDDCVWSCFVSNDKIPNKLK